MPSERIVAWVKTEDGTYSVDIIQYEGGLWLVPSWLDTPYPKMRKPARLIRLDALAHKDLGFLMPDHRRLVLDDPIPKSVLFGPYQSLQEPRYEVVEEPDLMIRRE
jgi:hypothetical protein